MQTIIKIKTSLKKMDESFEKDSRIRYYEQANTEDMEEIKNWKVSIRHREDEDPRILMNSLLNT